MNTFFSDSESEYKFVGTKSKQTVDFSKMSFSLAPSKKYTLIEKFENELKGSQNILHEIKKLELLREQEMKEIKNETKRKLNMLEDVRKIRCRFNDFRTKM